MAVFTIEIIGISICYFKDYNWKIIFPFDANHQHSVRFTDPTHINTSLAQRNQQILIAPVPAQPDLPPESGKIFDQFLNLTADYCHGDGVTHGNGIKLRDTFNNLDVVEMTVRGGEFLAKEPTFSRYRVRDVKHNTITLPPKFFGYSGEIIIESNALALSISTIPNIPNYTRDVTLTFNNTCNRAMGNCLPDFPMVYQVIQDAGDITQTFNVERDPRHLPHFAAPGEVMSLDDPDVVRSFDILRFRPLENPLPFVDGIPCHLAGSNPPPGDP
jgi:hypothetical protein